MSVYDKELVINGKAVRSPEQQVYKNMKDIEALQETIKPEYNTSAELTSSSVSVALSTTNAPSGTTEGWIITQDGLKFKITGGDESNLLLEFYCSIQGPQGETGPSGAELEIDDSGTSATKVWSSQKVSQELANAGSNTYRHNLYFTHDSPNYRFWITIENSSDTPFTETSFVQYMQDKGYNGSNFLKANGTFYDSGLKVIFGVYRVSTTQYSLCYQDTSGGISTSWNVNLNFFTIKDDVQEV